MKLIDFFVVKGLLCKTARFFQNIFLKPLLHKNRNHNPKKQLRYGSATLEIGFSWTEVKCTVFKRERP